MNKHEIKVAVLTEQRNNLLNTVSQLMDEVAELKAQLLEIQEKAKPTPKKKDQRKFL
jgi:predicted RNase H-like nuclease (RuvC/YqgF family)